MAAYQRRTEENVGGIMINVERIEIIFDPYEKEVNCYITLSDKIVIKGENKGRIYRDSCKCFVPFDDIEAISGLSSALISSTMKQLRKELDKI